MDRTQNAPLADLLTEDQAAGLLLVSARTLQAWRAKGEGPPVVRMGRMVRYKRSALLAWFDANSGGPEPAPSSSLPPPVFRAVEVSGEEGAAGHIATWCPWCERVHRHGLAGGGGNRAPHCYDRAVSPLRRTGYDLDVIGISANEDAVLPAAPMVKQDNLHHALTRSAVALRRPIIGAMLSMNRVSRDLVSRHLGNGWLWVFGLTRWRIKAWDDAVTDGEGLVHLASALFGVPHGVAAVRILEATTAETLDAEAAFGLQRVIDDWVARGAPKRGAAS